MDEQLREVLLSGETLYDGAIVHLEKWRVRLPNGQMVNREIVRHVGAAAVLAVNERNEACMVRQFRAPLDRITLEIPAGKLNDKRDDPLQTARRELEEETGLSAQSFRHLSTIHTSVGFCDEKIDLYLATGLSAGASHPDEDEFVQVVFMPYATLLQMALSGEISDSKTVCALLLAQPHLDGGSCVE